VSYGRKHGGRGANIGSRGAGGPTKRAEEGRFTTRAEDNVGTTTCWQRGLVGGAADVGTTKVVVSLNQSVGRTWEVQRGGLFHVERTRVRGLLHHGGGGLSPRRRMSEPHRWSRGWTLLEAHG